MPGSMRDAAGNLLAELLLPIHEATGSWLNRISAHRRAGIEAELDRTQEQLRATILQLAEALGEDAHAARTAMLRESFRATGTIPRPPRSPDD